MSQTIPPEEFKKIILESGSWAEAMEKLNALGINDKRSAQKRAVRLGVRINGGEKFLTTRVTTLTKDGKEILKWERQDLQKENLYKALRIATEELAASIEGLSPIIPAPKKIYKNLAVGLPLGDGHIGMYAWAKETGAPYDTQIASNLYNRGLERLIQASPPASECIISVLGDWIHVDNVHNLTSSLETRQDVDTRWARVIKVGIRIIRTAIDFALTKHQLVRVFVVPGNHDDQSSFLLSMVIQAFYKDNGRVIVDEGMGPFKYHTFGSNLIGMYHGHKVKPDRLPGIMATDRPQDWGNCKFRFWWTGHIHSKTAYEFPGCTVETFRSMVAKDAWTNSMGYRADRDIQLIVLHTNYGEIERHRVSIDMIE